MGKKSCILNKQADNGEISRLYTSLFNMLKENIDSHQARKQAWFLHGIFTSDEFLYKHPELILNDQDEPQFKDILKFLNKNAISKTYLKNTYEKTLNEGINSFSMNLVKDVVDFNNNQDDFVAVIESAGNSKPVIKLLDRNNKTILEKVKIENAYKFYNKVDGFLQTFGLRVHMLDSEQLNGNLGLMSPKAMETVKRDIKGIVNIANNMEGLYTLSEEFAHFLIENIKEDSPIIIRALEKLENNMDLVKEILGDDFEVVNDYYSAKNRKDLIAREALGRLLQNLLNEQNYLTNDKVLIRGVETASEIVKDTFKLDTREKSVAYMDLIQTLNSIATDPFSPSLISQKSLERFKQVGDELAHAANNFNYLGDVFRDAYVKSTKFLNQYSESTSEYTSEMIAGIEEAKNYLIEILNDFSEVYGDVLTEDGDFDDVFNNLKQTDHAALLCAFTKFYAKMAEVFAGQYDDIKEFNEEFSEDPEKQLRFNAKKILIIRDSINAFKTSIPTCRKLITSYKNKGIFENEINQLETVILGFDYTMNTFEDNYFELSRNCVYTFFKNYFGDSEGMMNIGGSSVKIMEVLEYCNGDMSLFNRLMQSGYNMDDLLVRMTQRVISIKQEETRLKNVELSHRIQALHRTYFNETGSNDTSFIYSTKNGYKDGFLINPYNRDFRAFYDAKNKFIKNLKEQDLTELQFTTAVKNWLEENSTEEVAEKQITIYNSEGKLVNKTIKRHFRVPSAKYTAEKSFERLTLPQQKYLKEYIAIKQELEFQLPGYEFHPFKAVQKTSSDMMESIISGKTAEEKFLMGTKAFKNKYQINENDHGEFFDRVQNKTFKQWIKEKFDKSKNGDVRIKTDFNSRIIHTVPVYYTDLLDNTALITNDATNALLNYGMMANNYKDMHSIVDFMELIKEVAETRKVLNRINGNPTKEILYDNGNTLELEGRVDAKTTNHYQALCELIEAQVYGKKLNPGKTIPMVNIPTAKLLQKLSSFTALFTLGYNTFSAINNVVVGKIQMFIESFGGEYFTMKDWIKADATYFSLLPEFLSELGSNSVTSKLGLIVEKFNIGMDWRETLEKKFSINGAFKCIGKFNPSFMMSIGEHHMTCSTGLARLMAIKVKDSSGKVMSFYDALEVKDVIKNGKNTGSKELVLKKGVKKLNGEPINFYNTQKKIGNKIYQSDVVKLARQIGVINHRMHGTYNAEDQNLANRNAFFRLVQQFRKWMIPTVTKHFGEQKYNFDLETETTGYVRDVGKMILNSVINIDEESKDSEFQKAPKQQELTAHQKANIKRTSADLFVVGLILALCIAMGARYKDDDDDYEGGLMSDRTLYYFTLRAKTEMTFYYNPIGEGLTLLQSPAAVLGPFQKYMKAFIYTFSSSGDHILETGEFKGYTKRQAAWIRSIPMRSQIYDWLYFDDDDKIAAIDNRRFNVYINN